ncbi:MAG: aminotransferase class V-fold PLP-dependent enzyme [Desulfovibrionaceae bacterium]
MGNEACWRDEFPVVKEMAFFNHSAVSPLPRRARDAGMAVFDDRWLRASMDYFRWLDVVRDARERAARLLGTAPAQVAFTGNTSSGLSIVAAGLPWREGDRVAVTWPDFPTLRFPFDALAGRGVRLVEIPRREGRIDLDEAATRIPGCRLVVASTVDWTTGAALDVAGLAALCRREGALLCLDAIQSLGVLSLDVTALGVDFVAAGCHKLQLGPMGLGIFYVAPGREELLAPVMVGWRSMEDEEHLGNTYRLKTGAGRFEAGTQDVAAIAAYGASLSLLEEVGLPRVRERIFAVQDRLRAGLLDRGFTILSPQGPTERSSILSFAHPDPVGVFRYFMEHGVMVSPRGAGIRLSPHFYNNATDVDRFFERLDAYRPA